MTSAGDRAVAEALIEKEKKAAAKLEAAKGKVDSKGAYAAVLAKFGY